MYCFHPINVRKWSDRTDRNGDVRKYQTNEYHLVPCGKCVGCLSRRRNEWTYRLQKEQEMSDYTFFGTLTYDKDHIPIKIKDEVPYFVFDKKHCQNYIKRVRYFINELNKDLKTSYYLCSEYGSIGLRPHYHFLFYVKNDKDLKYRKSIDRILRDTWENGFVTLKPANNANIHYVTKYCVKGLESLPPGCIDNVFILCSKRPYLGAAYESTLELQSNLALEPKVFINGYPNAMPRIYRRNLGVPGLSTSMSDLDPRLSSGLEYSLIVEYRKTHSSFDIHEFRAFSSSRLRALENQAKRKQLKRQEKL